ncbi:hypothetical protein [Escherichia coli]|uniref:hypothetical protein n=1 Tax=Escherichia coli TaxID=562 RepID=UPI000BE849CC|nr:hypothetical protein [Escherichia coli]
MTKRRKKYQEKEEIRHPDSPEGLVVAAANNRAFAERLVGVYRLAVTNGAIVIHTQRLKSDPGGNLLS